ncbi:MAG: NADH-quinone oxidoreductase subunit C [Ktedonobacterales bacterium]
MDLVPTSSTNRAVSASDRRTSTTLLQQLSQLDSSSGLTLPKRRLTGDAIGIDVPAEHLLEVAGVLRDTLGFEMMTCVSGVDMADHLESIYHFRSLRNNWLLQIRVILPFENPRVPSLVSLYPSANWLERETYDLFGIFFEGHPDLRRILLDDDFFGYPLRKSFRPTPLTVHDRATTQTDAVRAVTEEPERNVETITYKHLGQGAQERLHPGKLTFGSAAVFKQTGQGVVPVAEDALNALPETSDKDDKAGPASS